MSEDKLNCRDTTPNTVSNVLQTKTANLRRPPSNVKTLPTVNIECYVKLETLVLSSNPSEAHRIHFDLYPVHIVATKVFKNSYHFSVFDTMLSQYDGYSDDSTVNSRYTLDEVIARVAKLAEISKEGVYSLLERSVKSAVKARDIEQN